MENRPSENAFGPIGGRRRRDSTPTRVRGNEGPMQIGSDEEIERESTLGEGDGDQIPSTVILPERGELTGDEMVGVRGLLQLLRRRLAYIIERSHGTEFLSEQWWDNIDQIEAIGNSIEIIRREFRSD